MRMMNNPLTVVTCCRGEKYEKLAKTLTSPRGKTIDYELLKNQFVVKIDIPEFQKDSDFIVKGYINTVLEF